MKIKVNSKFEFTNVKCECADEKFCGFEYCFLKSVNRSYKYISIKVNLHKLPITNFSFNFVLWKRFNGYKPFLYNFTIENGCKFLGNPKSRNPVQKYFFDFFGPYGNMNHKCPFNHDIFIEKVPTSSIDYRLTKLLPFPEGDYLFDVTWLILGKPCTYVKVYGTLS
ncbi:uncharacterized protein Dwil_GK27642 [Drosophila willistoni]|uniref:MD-2-related lipid-recognition domain-containing protein n=1 Tax=Drosophila willistoni TaxID=7260 RepID=A0A0Q9WVS5_DROWI|nr:uncharacterized protein Dwil_GK27642 [Drosophila willistoni]